MGSRATWEGATATTKLRGTTMKYTYNEVNNFYGKRVFTSQIQLNEAFEQFEALYLAYNEIEHGSGTLGESQ
jgi:hypothetical protein